MVGLRCPECGHRQHANSARPAVLRVVGRLRGMWLFVAGLGRLGLCVLAGFIWMVVGTEWSGTFGSPRQVLHNDSYVLLALGAVLTGLGLRLVLVPAAWRLLPILGAFLIPAGALAGGLYIQRWNSHAVPLRLWTASVTVFPWLIVGAVIGGWHMWLCSWAMWPASAQLLLDRWRRCRAMPKIDLDRADPPQQTLLGEPVPTFCERCAAPIHDQPVQPCGECSLPVMTCPHCGQYTAVRSVRPVLEQALARVSANLLHGITFISVTVLYLALFGWFVFGYETVRSVGNLYGDKGQMGSYYEQSLWTECLIATVLAGVFGFCWRLVLLRWRSGLLTGLTSAGITGLVMLAGGSYCVLSRDDGTRTSVFTLFSYEFARAMLAVLVALTVGCASGWLILRLFIQLFTPKQLSTRLLAWRQSGRWAELIAMDGQTSSPSRQRLCSCEAVWTDPRIACPTTHEKS